MGNYQTSQLMDDAVLESTRTKRHHIELYRKSDVLAGGHNWGCSPGGHRRSVHADKI